MSRSPTRLTKTLLIFSGKSPCPLKRVDNHSDGHFREFVASYWPNKGTPGAQIKSMYDRIAHPAAETAPAPTSPVPDAAAKTNGIKAEPVPLPTPTQATENA